MILIVGELPGISTQSLLAHREGKRGPVASIEGLGDLREGDKLHIVGPFAEGRLAGLSPEALAEMLAGALIGRSVRLSQVHLISPSTGHGRERSFAERLDLALRRQGTDVDEIKAPLGDVRCDSTGKIWVRLEHSREWVPSSPAVNHYCGPRVAEKHRR
jgi:hypothetical protein